MLSFSVAYGLAGMLLFGCSCFPAVVLVSFGTYLVSKFRRTLVWNLLVAVVYYLDFEAEAEAELLLCVGLV